MASLKWLTWLVVLLPFLGFAVLSLAGGRMSRRRQALVGVGSVGLAALVTLLITYSMIKSPPSGDVYRQVIWTWFSSGGLTFQVAFAVDSLAVIMMLVVTVVGFLIHLYSADHMRDDEGFRRFFASMNLFVGSMLLLVMADNLLLLFFGWEGVGLCSFLLIGHWYRNWDNASAARKAFVVTRIGDAAMMIGLVLIVTQLGTLRISEVLAKAPGAWGTGSATAIVAAALLLGGAVGKSAQIPLHTWLPDAMAGPSPVSALIHAATMVTAGVYLIARTHTLFTIAPPVLLAVAIIGGATLFYASMSAFGQTDIKRVLAYSTISQIGYMFAALGVGAWGAAIFHLMTHAFFKATLFLSAGVVIEAMGGEHDIRKMGGLRKRLPIAFWTFLIGGASLAALPIVTAGFYSKELIIDETLASPLGKWWLWAVAAVTAGLTAIYIFRVVFVVFLGEPAQDLGKEPAHEGPGEPGAEPHRWMHDALPLEAIALVALSVLSVLGGLEDTPLFMHGQHWFTDFLSSTLPVPKEAHVPPLAVELIAPVLGVLGIVVAWLLYRGRHELPAFSVEPEGRAVAAFFRIGWGFDVLYDWLFVRPYVWVARVSRRDPVDAGVTGLVWINRMGWRLLSSTESGLVRLYAAGAGIGFAVLAIILAVTR